MQLQQKLDRAKEAYASLLSAMGTLNSEISEAQVHVQSAQMQLQQHVADAPADGGLPDLQHVLQQAGVNVTDAQVDSIRSALLTAQAPQLQTAPATQVPSGEAAAQIADLQEELARTMDALAASQQAPRLEDTVMQEAQTSPDALLSSQKP